MSKIIAIEKIEEGMILAESVVNKHGQVLIPNGMELKSNHKRIFKSWNIKFVNIKELEDENELIEISPELFKMAKREIDELINWKPENELEMDLYKACITFKAKNKNNG